MRSTEPTTADIMNHLSELTEFIQEHVATKDDLERYATKEDMQSFRSETLSLLDHVVKDYDINQTEHLAIHHRLGRHEDQIDGIAKHIGMAH